MSMETLGLPAAPAGAVSGLLRCAHPPAPLGNPLLTSALSLLEGREHEASPTGQGAGLLGVAILSILIGHLPGQVLSDREEGTQCLPSGSTCSGGAMVVILCHSLRHIPHLYSYGSHSPSHEVGRHPSLQLLQDRPPASQLAWVSLHGHQRERAHSRYSPNSQDLLFLSVCPFQDAACSLPLSSPI